MTTRDALLVETIASLLSVGVAPTRHQSTGDVQGTVTRRVNGKEVERFEVWTQASEGCWEVDTIASGERVIFNPIDGLLTVFEDEREELPISERAMPPMHVAAQFAFPLRLPVWGRYPIDRWRIQSAEPAGLGTFVMLESIVDSDSTARLRIASSGLPMEIGNDMEELILSDVRPLLDPRRFWWGS